MVLNFKAWFSRTPDFVGTKSMSKACAWTGVGVDTSVPKSDLPYLGACLPLFGADVLAPWLCAQNLRGVHNS